MGGTSRSALLAIDLLMGASFTASGRVMLDARGTIDATLNVDGTADQLINATELAAVAFTVSGLERGEAGTVTFADETIITLRSESMETGATRRISPHLRTGRSPRLWLRATVWLRPETR